MQKSNKHLWLVYDGACPVCNAFANTIQLKKAVGQLHLINAREKHPIICEIERRKLDLNEGVVVKFNNVFYHGANALHMLAVLSSKKNLFNKINSALFSYPMMAKICYPMLKFMRHLLLKIKRIEKIKINE